MKVWPSQKVQAHLSSLPTSLLRGCDTGCSCSVHIRSQGWSIWAGLSKASHRQHGLGLGFHCSSSFPLTPSQALESCQLHRPSEIHLWLCWPKSKVSMFSTSSAGELSSSYLLRHVYRDWATWKHHQVEGQEVWAALDTQGGSMESEWKVKQKAREEGCHLSKRYKVSPACVLHSRGKGSGRSQGSWACKYFRQFLVCPVCKASTVLLKTYHANLCCTSSYLCLSLTLGCTSALICFRTSAERQVTVYTQVDKCKRLDHQACWCCIWNRTLRQELQTACTLSLLRQQALSPTENTGDTTKFYRTKYPRHNLETVRHDSRARQST